MTDANAPQASSLEPTTVALLTRAAAAAKELCDLLWVDLQRELRDPREGRVRELSERLAAVSSTVALLADTPGPSQDAARAQPREPSNMQAEVGQAPAGQALTGRAPMGQVATGQAPMGQAPMGQAPMGQAPMGQAPMGQAATQERRTPPDPIWSERSRPPEPSGPPPPPPTPHPSAQGLRAHHEPARMRLVDEHEHHSATTTLQPLPGSFAGPESPPLRGVRPEQGASAWVNTVGRLLACHALDGLPFAVLLVELIDIARIEHSEAPEEVTRLVRQVEAALAHAMRAEDELTRESLGRYWLVTPETNGTGARMLAERLARLVRSSASHRGVPLEVAIGIAVCPEDGCDAPELAARADLSVYSARATGQPVARAEPPRR